MGEEIFIINKSHLYHYHFDTNGLGGFITIDNSARVRILNIDTAKLTGDSNHPDYKLVCSHLLNLFNCNIEEDFRFIVCEKERVITAFKYAIAQGYPINWCESKRTARIDREQIPEDDMLGKKLDLYIDIYNLLSLCRFDCRATWEFIKYYIGLINPNVLIKDSPIVKSIINSVLCIADINPNDNIGTLIDVLLEAGIPFDGTYYDLLFEFYTISQFYTGLTYNRPTYDVIYNKATIKMIKLGIKKGIKLSNENIKYIRHSFYDVVFMNNSFDIIEMHQLLFHTLCFIESKDGGKEHIDEVYEILTDIMAWNSITSNYMDAVKAKSWPDIINGITHIFDLQILFNDGYITPAKEQVLSSIDYLQSTEPVFSGPTGSLVELCKMYNKHRDAVTEIYTRIVTGFKLVIPINDNAIYLYKKLHCNNIINYKEWQKKHYDINKKSYTVKLDFIIREKCSSVNSITGQNFASLRKLIIQYF